MIKPHNYTLRFLAFLIIFFSVGTGNTKSLISESLSLDLTEEPHFSVSDFNVEFKGDIEEKVKQCFLKVLSHYPSLHKYDIEVKRKKVKSATMQAQPVFSFKGLFGGAKKYKIKLGKYVQDSDNIAINDLPEEVITGWFAHELGHLVDYESYSGGQMIWYGLKYLLSGNFRKKVEYEADYIALKSGFYEEILAAKKFVLENNIGKDYLDRIREFYLSIEDVQAYVEDEALLQTEDEM